MDFKLLFSTFGIIFLAELGDKTQLATMCYAAECESKISVLLGSASALVLNAMIAVAFGSFVSRFIPGNFIKIGAGALFIIIGLWMIFAPNGK